MEAIYEPINNFYNGLNTKAHESTFFRSILEDLELKSKVPISYIVTGITTFVLLFFLWCYGSELFVDMLAVFYPAYLTFQALEKKDDEKISYWNKYWVFFGMYHIGEELADEVISWLYCYAFWKLCFLIFCFMPVQKNGAVILYENFIKANFLYNTETGTAIANKIKGVTGGK